MKRLKEFLLDALYKYVPFLGLILLEILPIILVVMLFCFIFPDKPPIEDRFDDPVVYNHSTRIYHELDCEWAEKCTENCSMMERCEAKELGRHCHVCHE